MTNLPFSGKFKVTCEYGRKNSGSLKWAKGSHPGVDLVGKDSTEIYATCDGKIHRTGYDKSYGNYVVIKEDNANRYHWFCHLKRILKTYGKVSRFTIIGIMGATGNVTGAHLHYEIRNASNKYGDDQNPATYMGLPNVVGEYHSKDYQLNENYLRYDAHIQNIGWQGEQENGEIAGTEGKGLRVEAIIINSNISIQYRVHIQDKGWSEFVPNGCMAGTTGESLRVEALEIISSSKPIRAQAHVEKIGWQEPVEGTQIKIGTEGQALRLEALKLEFI